VAIPQLLRDLLVAPGPSGVEAAPAAVWRAAAGEFADEVRGDVMGSSVAVVEGRAAAPLLAVVGHIDEIGLIVHHIDDEGMLWFSPVGGWDPQILVGQRVEVQTKDGPLPGVIGRKPIHLLEEEERKQVPKLKDLHLDIGAKDADEARSLVRIGDVAVVEGEPIELPNRRVVSRALDNRLGSYVALEVARAAKDAGGAPGLLAGVAAAQEEIGSHGAATMAFALRPDVAIAVDVTHATDSPGIEVNLQGKHELGSGPVIGRGSVLHPAVFELLHATAEEEGIPFTVEVSGRGTYTDADALHLSREGVATGLVSLPLRYMHSPVEMVSLDDVEATIALIAAFAQRLSAESDFAR